MSLCAMKRVTQPAGKHRRRRFNLLLVSRRKSPDASPRRDALAAQDNMTPEAIITRDQHADARVIGLSRTEQPFVLHVYQNTVGVAIAR